MMTFEDIIEQATGLMLRDHHHNNILLISLNKGNMVFQLENLPATADERHLRLQGLGFHLANANPGALLESVFMIAEMWAATETLENTDPRRKFPKDFVTPSQRADRREILSISGRIVRPTLENKTAMFDIVRGKNDVVLRLDRRDLSDVTEIENYLLMAFVNGFNYKANLRRN